MPLEAPTYPTSLVLAGRRCLVVGAGRVARRKIEGLLDARADVTVVATEVSPEVAAMAVTVERRPYRSGDVTGYVLVIAATGDPEVDRLVSREAQQANILVNVADDPDSCTFVLPAVARHGPVSVAVSTDGQSPAFARWTRDRLSATFGKELEAIAPMIARVRARLRGEGRSSQGRDWDGLIAAVHQASSTKGNQGAEEEARRWMERWLDDPPPAQST